MNLLEMALTSSNSTETATDQHPEITNTNSCYPTSRVPVNGDIVESELFREVSELEATKFTKDTAVTLVSIWITKSNLLVSESDSLPKLIQLTTNYAISGSWLKVDTNVQSQLKEAILQFNNKSTGQENGCLNLIRLIDDGPWEVSYLQEVLNVTDFPLKQETVEGLFTHETTETIKCRIECLCLAKEYEKALNLALAAVCQAAYIAAEGVLLIDEIYYQFGAIFALLMYKLQLDDKWAPVMKFITLAYLNELLERLRRPDPNLKIAPKWKSGWKYAEEAMQYCSERFLFETIKADLHTPIMLKILQAVFTSWLNSTTDINKTRSVELLKASGRVALYQGIQNESEELTEDNLILLNTIPVETIDLLPKMVYKQSYLAHFAKCIAQKYGLNILPIRLKCIDLCLIGILNEINTLEQLRATSTNPELIKEKEEELSTCYQTLTEFFQEDVSIQFELLLTSFSLSPTEDLKNALQQLAELRTQEPESESWNPLIGLGNLPTSIHQTLCTVINNGRLTCFNTMKPCWNYYSELLEAHLNAALNTKATSVLTLAQPDYESFVGLTKPPEEEEIVFEKGFEPQQHLDGEEMDENIPVTIEPKERLRSLKLKNKSAIVPRQPSKLRRISNKSNFKKMKTIDQQKPLPLELPGGTVAANTNKRVDFTEIEAVMPKVAQTYFDFDYVASENSNKRRDSSDSAELRRTRKRTKSMKYSEDYDSDNEVQVGRRAPVKKNCSGCHTMPNNFLWPAWTRNLELGTATEERFKASVSDDDEVEVQFLKLTESDLGLLGLIRNTATCTKNDETFSRDLEQCPNLTLNLPYDYELNMANESQLPENCPDLTMNLPDNYELNLAAESRVDVSSSSSVIKSDQNAQTNANNTKEEILGKKVTLQESPVQELQNENDEEDSDSDVENQLEEIVAIIAEDSQQWSNDDEETDTASETGSPANTKESLQKLSEESKQDPVIGIEFPQSSPEIGKQELVKESVPDSISSASTEVTHSSPEEEIQEVEFEEPLRNSLIDIATAAHSQSIPEEDDIQELIQEPKQYALVDITADAIASPQGDTQEGIEESIQDPLQYSETGDASPQCDTEEMIEESMQDSLQYSETADARPQGDAQQVNEESMQDTLQYIETETAEASSQDDTQEWIEESMQDSPQYIETADASPQVDTEMIEESMRYQLQYIATANARLQCNTQEMIEESIQDQLQYSETANASLQGDTQEMIEESMEDTLQYVEIETAEAGSQDDTQEVIEEMQDPLQHIETAVASSQDDSQDIIEEEAQDPLMDIETACNPQVIECIDLAGSPESSPPPAEPELPEKPTKKKSVQPYSSTIIIFSDSSSSEDEEDNHHHGGNSYAAQSRQSSHLVQPIHGRLNKRARTRENWPQTYIKDEYDSKLNIPTLTNKGLLSFYGKSKSIGNDKKSSNNSIVLTEKYHSEVIEDIKKSSAEFSFNEDIKPSTVEVESANNNSQSNAKGGSEEQEQEPDSILPDIYDPDSDIPCSPPPPTKLNSEESLILSIVPPNSDPPAKPNVVSPIPSYVPTSDLPPPTLNLESSILYPQQQYTYVSIPSDLPPPVLESEISNLSKLPNPKRIPSGSSSHSSSHSPIRSVSPHLLSNCPKLDTMLPLSEEICNSTDDDDGPPIIDCYKD